MFKKLAAFVLPVALLASSVAPATAHHSPAAFDLTVRTSISGVLREATFRNPHGHLSLDVTNAQGRVQTWTIETSAANLLRRRGWDFSKIRPGMRVTIVGHPNKTVPFNIYTREVRMADGTVFGDRYGNDTALD